MVHSSWDASPFSWQRFGAPPVCKSPTWMIVHELLHVTTLKVASSYGQLLESCAVTSLPSRSPFLELILIHLVAGWQAVELSGRLQLALVDHLHSLHPNDEGELTDDVQSLPQGEAVVSRATGFPVQFYFDKLSHIHFAPQILRQWYYHLLSGTDKERWLIICRFSASKVLHVLWKNRPLSSRVTNNCPLWESLLVKCLHINHFTTN